jgi:hypothetical protein
MPSPSAQTNLRELSSEGRAAAAWFSRLGRALRVFRLYRGENPVVLEAQEGVATALAELLASQGAWQLHFSAQAIEANEETVVRVVPREVGSEKAPSVTDQLPFLFYRDGIRRLVFAADTPRGEIDTFVQVLRRSGAVSGTQDDLVTLLWQANLSSIQLEAVPLEQTIYLTTRPDQSGPGGGGNEPGQSYAVAPTGAELHANLGQAAGAQGLHRDTFDDWPLPEGTADVPQAFARLEPLAEMGRVAFLAAWETERGAGWRAQANGLLRVLRALDDSTDMARALAHAAVTWLGSALQEVNWDDAQCALEVLNELDPRRELAGDTLATTLSDLDGDLIAERLDEGEGADHNRFAAFTVALGPPAVGLCIAIMTHADKARARAACVTALCYLCAEEPELLAPWLSDTRWHVVRNVLFVLGHIGGPGVGALLGSVAHHPEPRVRRQLIQALASVPPETRTPLLIAQLEVRDSQLLSAALNVMTRERDPLVARAILDCVESPDFESRDEASQRALFGALGDVADDQQVSALETLLHKGGWFSRRTFERMAAARTLRRIGTPRAMAMLEAGLRDRSEAVRAACIEALGTRSRP